MADKKQDNESGREKTGSASMIAPHPPVKAKAKGQEKEPLEDVEDMAEAAGLPTWETAGMMAAAGWVSGKQVTKSEFNSALDKFKSRRQGGGRIQA